MLAITVAVAGRGEWNQWRGPDRDGKSLETGLLDEWPQSGPELAWTIDSLGSGYSSLAAGDGTLVTQGLEAGRQFLVAVDADTGETRWKTSHGEPYSNRRGDGPRGTPTIDGDRVYAQGGDGNLICADLRTGNKIWEKNLLRAYGGRNIRWGISESPLVDGDRLIVNAGGVRGSVVALNKDTGAEVWRTQSDRAGYSSAVVAVTEGLRQYVVFTGEGALGILAENGELLWRYSTVSNSTANIATPIIHGDLVFLSSAYGTGCALLRLSRSGGSVEASEVYFNRNMMNHYTSSILIDGYLYGFSGRILTAMRLETGEVAWKDRAAGKGQMIYAEGKLYVLSDDGVVSLVDPDPAGYKELSRFRLDSRDYPTWTLPVISRGVLYVRDQERLHAYDVAAR